MNNLFRKIFLTLAVFLFSANIVFAYTSPGAPSGFVNDFAGVISGQTKQSLNIDLQNFAKDKNHEVVVVTIKNLEGDTIENYANSLFREWGIGKKEYNNGVLFLVAIDDRQMRIEVGYGLEGALTDIESKHILDDVVRPYFKSGDYEKGIVSGATEIKKAIEGEIVATKQSNNNDLDGVIEVVFVFGIIFISWFGSILARSRSWWLGGVIGGVTGVILWAILGIWFFILIGAIVGLIFDYLVSKNYQSGKRSWWAGGDRGFGGGSFGGGGGFGGFGGGSSGGGGSSSRW